MKRQEILNIAGVGYLQGKIIDFLEEHYVEHEITVDGMFGPKTLAGLNWILNSRFHFTIELTLPSRSNIVPVVWTDGVQAFQSWYAIAYGQITEVRGKTSIPRPNTDGKWGPLTKAIVDEITKIV